MSNIKIVQSTGHQLLLATRVIVNPVMLQTVPSNMPISPIPWMPIAALAVLIVITVAGLVYALSGLWGGSGARAWSKKQILEAILSLALLLIFGFIYKFFLISPSGAFGSFGLIPQPNDLYAGCNTATTLFTLSSCDIAAFQSMSFHIVGFALYAFAIPLLTPGLSVKATVPFTAGLVSFSWKIGSVIGSSLGGAGGTVITIFITALMLNRVQLLLVAAAPLLLSFFLTLGLVARTFGITRSFGGTMIAFAIGLGFVYPLLVAITYGFISVQIGAYYQASIFTVFSTGNISAAADSVWKVLTAMITNNPAAVMTAIHSAATAADLLIQDTTILIGYMVAGLTLIPILNLAILGAFINDTSRAFGDQMSFQLFSNIF